MYKKEQLWSKRLNSIPYSFVFIHEGILKFTKQQQQKFFLSRKGILINGSMRWDKVLDSDEIFVPYYWSIECLSVF